MMCQCLACAKYVSYGSMDIYFLPITSIEQEMQLWDIDDFYMSKADSNTVSDNMLTEVHLIGHPDAAQQLHSSLEQLVKPPPFVAAYDSKIWPKPPELPASASHTNAHQQEYELDTDESDNTEESDGIHNSSDKESLDEELDVKDIELDAEKDHQTTDRLSNIQPPDTYPSFMQDKFTSHLEDMKTALKNLNEVIISQSKEISQMKAQDSLEFAINSLNKQLKDMNFSFTNKLDQVAGTHKRDMKFTQDKLTQSVGKLQNDVRISVEKTVSTELKKNLEQLMDPIKKDLHVVMAEKLTASDATFKESINRLVNSQSTVERIGQAVGVSVQDVMLSAHKDSLQQQILPSFDSMTRQMYQHLNESFKEGLNEFMKQFERHVGKIKAEQMNTQKIIEANCDTAIKTLNDAKGELQGKVLEMVRSEVATQVQASLNNVIPQLVAEVRSTVKQVVETTLESHKKTFDEKFEELRSAAATPAPDRRHNSELIKEQIETFMQLKDYEKAFSCALSASDLSLVVHLIKLIPDSSVVFSDPCPLSQPTLLSLIHQLSCGLSGTDVQSKLDFLLDALNNLNMESPVTRQNLQFVTNSVKDKTTEYLAKNPSHASRQTISTIQRAIKSFSSLLNTQKKS